MDLEDQAVAEEAQDGVGRGGRPNDPDRRGLGRDVDDAAGGEGEEEGSGSGRAIHGEEGSEQVPRTAKD